MNDTFVTFEGWVGSDVTLSETRGGAQVASFRVGSTPRHFRDGAWSDGETAWFTVKCWRSLALNVHQSIRNGEAVIVHGKLVADVWEKSPTETSVRYIVVATSVGHDLTRGTAEFTKSPRKLRAEDNVQQVIHEYDEDGPRLDSDGEVVQPAAA